MDIRSRIDSRRMGAYQWTIIAIALFINSLDGYDMVAMAFAAAAVGAALAAFGATGACAAVFLVSAVVFAAAGAFAAFGFCVVVVFFFMGSSFWDPNTQIDCGAHSLRR